MKNLLTLFLSSAHLAQCPEMNQSLQMFVQWLLHWWHRTQALQTLPPRAQNSKYCGRWGSGKPRCLSGPLQMIKSQLTDRNTPAHDSPCIFSRLQRQDLSCKPSQRRSRAPERLLLWRLVLSPLRFQAFWSEVSSYTLPSGSSAFDGSCFRTGPSPPPNECRKYLPESVTLQEENDNQRSTFLCVPGLF